MYFYNDKHLEELKKYNSLFINSMKIPVMIELVTEILDSNSNKEVLMRNLSKKYKTPTNTIYFWMRQYQKEGVESLYSIEEVVTLFLEESERPIGEWNRRSLCEYLRSNKVKIQDIEFTISPSETLCWNILNKLTKEFETGSMDNLNILFQEKSGKEYCFTFIDYVRIPNKTFTGFSKYIYIILSWDDLILKKVVFDRTKMDKKDNEIVRGFQSMLDLITKGENSKLEMTVVLSNDEINRKARSKYMKQNPNANIVLFNKIKAKGKLIEWYDLLEEIKYEMKSNPEIIENDICIKVCIDNYSKKIENIYRE